jgi:ATP adenylyltransferase
MSAAALGIFFHLHFHLYSLIRKSQASMVGVCTIGEVMSTSARFDWVISGCSQGPEPACDQDLFNHPMAAVVPTLGSLVPGWLLVVPRAKSLALRDLPQQHRRDILNLARQLADEVKVFGRTPFILEHGPSKPSSAVGCGVDQSHLHVVPMDRDLLNSALADKSVLWTFTSMQDPWSSCSPGQEYLLICRDDECYIGVPYVAQSQYFRRKIAHICGTPDAWDYREWPCHENAQRTIEYFAGARQHRAA